MIYIKNTEPSLFPGKINAVVECRQDESVALESFAGTKYFYMRAGQRTRLRLPKSRCYEKGDGISLKELVLADQTKFKWDWNPPRRSKKPAPGPVL